MYKLKNNLIMFHSYFNGRRLVMSTGEKCLEKDWNASKQLPKSNLVLKTLLDRFESRVSECHLQLRSQFEVVTPELLRAAVQREIRTGGKREVLVEWVKRTLAESKLSPGTLAGQDSAYKIFKAYKGAKDYNDITPTWFTAFQQHMETEEYSAGYIAKTISIIKGWLKQSGQQGLHRNVSYKSFTMSTEQSDAIYLNSDELSAIKKAELSPSLDRVRCRFLISCYTGLRFSDNLALTPDSIQGGFIRNRNKKTGAVVVIPIHPVVQSILNRYPSGLPKSLTNKQTNIDLKKIGKAAGIDTQIEITKFVGGKAVKSTVPKYELICSHTGRRSFSSNAILAGIPSAAVRRITGHSSEASFNRYIKISQQTNAEALQGHKFFAQ